MALTAAAGVFEEVGYFRVFARPPGGLRREVTIFRGAPVMVNNCAFGDPFSEQTAQISLPQVTPWDNLGDGDLDWLVPDADIDIVWQSTGKYVYDWRWEGAIVSFDFSVQGSQTTFNISMKGCLYGLDDYLATPSFPKRPIPYESLIRQAFDPSRHPARLSPIQIEFPVDWELRVPEDNTPEYLNFLKPWGVSTGQLWTGFTSRSTGSWEPVLTGHVQSLLSVMFSQGGNQWTIRNMGHRRPKLFLRQKPQADDPSIIEITLGAPGVNITGSKDFSQRANVIYGSGTDDAGISYNGMNVTANGDQTYFKPFAYNPTSYPRSNNPRYDFNVKPKEVMVQFQNGVSEDAAIKIAQSQLNRFNEPGITGNITLTSDVQLADGTPFPRMLIKAGVSVRVFGLFGMKDGLLVHITSAQADFTGLTMTLTYDSKYRDELTVEEVRARTKDALTPLRSLQVGKYSNTVQDLILPWSYREGSGCVPLGAKEFFLEKISSASSFPYEDFTTQFPPKNYPNYYIEIGPTNTINSTKNWSGVYRDNRPLMSVPIRMSQAGTIKLSQIAAYDKDGNVLPVKFHFSVYSTNGIAADAMPKFEKDPETAPEINYLRPEGITTNYDVHQSNPFFEGGWETVRPDGTTYNPDYNIAPNAGLVVGWGNYYEPAGYWPGRFSRGAVRTGIMQDTTPWTWDLSSTLDFNSPENNSQEEYSGMLFVQIYCDDQGDEPVFFMGRFFRQEPGTQ